MAEQTPASILADWMKTGTAPEGWEVDLDDDPEGGQPNGVGTIESSSEREWFTKERETHHRERLVITITGPWVPGPTETAKIYQEVQARNVQNALARREAQILAEAAEIQARRAAEGLS